MNTPTAIPSATPFIGAPAIDFGGTVGIGARPSLRAAAQEVEQLFLSMLLKEMRQSLGSEDQEGMFAGDSADVYGGLFDMYLGKHLADAGGVGLTSVWAQQLEQQSQPQEHANHGRLAERAGFGADLPRSPRP